MEGPEAHEKYVKDFMAMQFPAGDVPVWAVEALASVDIRIETTLTTSTADAAVAADGGSEVADAKKARVGDSGDNASSSLHD
jgi:hypothetical protein